ncbi:hypothetical protein LIA77_11277 [Sarocladium implicatum]|nr:hypothetical protein LIA77_11277 [Sarocladium implicatum]
MTLLPARSALCARATTRVTLTSSSRSFTTTSINAQDAVPPQSPSYIRLPSPPQSSEPQKQRVRGHLPVPREIFPRREGDRKIQPDYIQKTAPLPKDANEAVDSSKPVNKVREWKRRMASQRRENLEESLQTLWTRSEERHRKQATRTSANFLKNKRAMNAPEREDDRITRSTVLDSLMDTSVKPDPDRFARAERGIQNVAQMQAKKRDERRDALMDLYMKASDFIVHEKDLKAEIERVFAEDVFRKKATSRNSIGAADNVWDVDGSPTTIGDMVLDAMGTSKRPLEASTTEFERSAMRTKRIAEEFTGGRSPVPDSKKA